MQWIFLCLIFRRTIINKKNTKVWVMEMPFETEDFKNYFYKQQSKFSLKKENKNMIKYKHKYETIFYIIFIFNKCQYVFNKYF